jgi:hypothetical protein
MRISQQLGELILPSEALEHMKPWSHIFFNLPTPLRKDQLGDAKGNLHHLQHKLTTIMS